MKCSAFELKYKRKIAVLLQYIRGLIPSIRYTSICHA